MCSLVGVSMLVIPILAVVGYFYVMMGFTIELSFNDQGCRALLASTRSGVHDTLVNSEDMAHVSNGLFLVSAGDLTNTFNGDTDKQKPGTIWLLQLPTNTQTSPELWPLRMSNTPDDFSFSFHPHGIYYSHARRWLYCVSHGLEKYGGSVVVVFAVNGIDASQSYASLSDVSLTYLGTISSSHFLNAGINDVIEANTRDGDDHDTHSFYVTEWLQYPYPPKGKAHPQNSKEKLDLIKQTIAQLVIPGTHVYRCSFSLSPSPSVSVGNCSVAASGYYGANGITKQIYKDDQGLIVSGRHIYINDLPAKKVHVYTESNNSDSDHQRSPLTFIKSIPLKYSVDNVEYDFDNGHIYAGSLPLIYRVIQLMEGHPNTTVPGGLTVIKQHNSKHTATASDTDDSVEYIVDDDALMHDGSKVTQLSSGYQWKQWTVLGSPFSNGVLLCPSHP